MCSNGRLWWELKEAKGPNGRQSALCEDLSQDETSSGPEDVEGTALSLEW